MKSPCDKCIRKYDVGRDPLDHCPAECECSCHILEQSRRQMRLIHRDQQVANGRTSRELSLYESEVPDLYILEQRITLNDVPIVQSLALDLRMIATMLPFFEKINKGQKV